MRLLFVSLAVLCAIVEGSRSKRFAALASGIGGAAGCVVTGDNLYANGFLLRPLNDTEIQELNQYTTALSDWKKKVRAAQEARQQRLQQMMNNDGNSNEVTESSATTTAPNLEPPKRPSFCSENQTTQYYFDGCMVQNNKVYVGKTFARDLTPQEVQQLQDFDTKMTAYQKQVQDNLQQQMKGFFGGSNFLSALFGAEDASSSSSSSSSSGAPTTTARSLASSTSAPLVAPDPPKFCYAI